MSVELSVGQVRIANLEKLLHVTGKHVPLVLTSPILVAYRRLSQKSQVVTMLVLLEIRSREG